MASETPIGAAAAAAAAAAAQGTHAFLGKGQQQIRVSHVCFDEFIDRASRRRRRGSDENDSSSSSRPTLAPVIVTGAPRSSHLAPGIKMQQEKEHLADGRAQVAEHRQGGSSDELESMQKRRQGPTTTGSTAKTTQHHLPGGVDIEESHVIQALSEDDEDSARCWHDGRRAALAEMEALAAKHGSAGSAATTPLAESGKEPARGEREGDGPFAPPTLHVVLADDNMHFRSMRHQVFSTARKYGCGYAQVYFPTDVEIAVERNKRRKTPVAEAVIRKMAENIQPPDPDRFQWERHTAVAEPLLTQPSPRAASAPTEGCPSRCRAGTAGGGGEDRASMSSRGFRSSNPGSSSGDNFGVGGEPGRAEHASDDPGSRQSFWLAIAAAAAAEGMATSSSVSSAAATSPLEQEADREKTRASLQHRFDLQLREAVKRVAQRAADAALARDALAAVMSACSAARKNAMRSAKETSRNGVSRKTDGQDGGESSEAHADFPFTPEDLPPFEQFVGEFEEALGEVEDMRPAIRSSLIEAARNLA